MVKYISFGQFNKNSFFILGSVVVKFIINFIYGFTPDLVQNNTIYIFGFKSFIFSHYLFTNCLKYSSMILGGIISHFIYNRINKAPNNDEIEKNDEDLKNGNHYSNGDIIEKMIKNEDEINDKKYIKSIVIIFIIYFLSQSVNDILNNIGFNLLKLWPLESIFIFFFIKKILNRTMYKHQKITIIAVIILCTSIYVICSFLPKEYKDCILLTGNEKQQCEMSNENIYNTIIKYLGWFFIPIFIIIYFLSMIGDAYAKVSIKWLIDIKYIAIPRILFYIGIIGFTFSIAAFFISSFIPCNKGNDYIDYICSFENEGELYYDNYKNLNVENKDSHFYIDIFITLPIFLLLSFFDKFFELLIIIKSDPFYFIPIDCSIFLIYEIIDYGMTFSLTNEYNDTKFALLLLCDSNCVFLCLIYLEIIELHFCNLDRFLRRYIMKREFSDKSFIVMEEISDKTDESKERS